MTEPPTHVLARSIHPGDFIHAREDEPPIKVTKVIGEGKIVKFGLEGRKKLFTVYRSDLIRVTLKEFA
jgi:hypothetical protein